MLIIDSNLVRSNHGLKGKMQSFLLIRIILKEDSRFTKFAQLFMSVLISYSVLSNVF